MIKVKSFFYKYRRLIPVIIMSILLIITFFNSYEIRQWFSDEISAYMIIWKHYLALVLVILCFAVFFFFRKYYKYILIVTLITGLLNIICFTSAQYEYFIRIGSATLNFQSTTFFIILITYFTNYKSANKHIFQFLADLRS